MRELFRPRLRWAAASGTVYELGRADFVGLAGVSCRQHVTA
jgi:hypothetical protein